MDELAIGGLDVFEGAVMFHMFGVHVGDHGYGRGQARKGPSLSSASTTIMSLLPKRVLVP